MQSLIQSIKELKGIHKLQYICLLLAALTMPLYKIAISVTMGVACAVSLIDLFRQKDFKARQYMMFFYIMLALYGVHLLGLLYTTNIKAGLFDVQVKLLILVAPLVLITGIVNKQRLTKILYAFSLGCFMNVLVCLAIATFKYVHTKDISVFFYTKFSVLMHPTYLALYLCLAFTFICFENIRHENSSRYYRFFSLTIYILGAFLASSKTGYLNFMVVILSIQIYFFYNRYFKSAFMLTGLLLLLLLIFKLCPNISMSRISKAQEVFSNKNNISNESSESTATRLLVWNVAYRLACQEFLTGFGTGDAKDELLKVYEKEGMTHAFSQKLNAHNEFLQVLLSVGVLGFLLLLASMLFAIWVAFKQKSFLIFIFVVSLSINFLTESMLETQAGVCFFAFFISCFILSIDKTESKNDTLLSPRIDQKIIDEVVDTLKSGWITTGPKTKRFEKELAAYSGNKATLCLNSATAGLELMLRWYGVKEGDEVILPAYTYSATANVVIHCGAKPIFVDVNKHDFNISVNDIRKAITKNTKVIMPVDFAGYPCDYNEINALVNEPAIKTLFTATNENQHQLGRIMILSDAAHSVGATYHGRLTGSLTDVSVFSFHAVKNLTTAEGGAVALNLPEPFNNEELYNTLCVRILHGQNKDALAKTQKGNWRYDIVEAGFKANMTDIMASIGLVELARYNSDTLPKRKAIFDFYTRELSQYAWAEVPEYTGDVKVSSYHVYALRIKGITEQQRDSIMQEIFNKDVSVNVHFIPVPMMSFYRSLGYDIQHYPVAFNNYSREISLPVFYDLNEEQLKTIVAAIVSAVNRVLQTVVA